MIPIWFLDIDGVVNALGPVPPEMSGESVLTTATTQGIDWPIAYSPAIVDRINALSRVGVVEIHWLTTWTQDAHRSLAPAIGLDAFPAFDEPADLPPGRSWWKAEVVRRELGDRPRPFIWTDDDLTEARMDEVDSIDASSLLIAPDREVGLIRDQVDRIERFCHTIRELGTRCDGTDIVKGCNS